MKNNKKLILIVVLGVTLLILGIILFLNLNNKKDKVSDASKFKEEYEKLNDTYAYGNVKYSKLNISDSNPFVYANYDKVIDTLKNETGIIYFGYPKCPWCRNAVNVLQYLNVNEILYLDMYDKRDEYKVEDGNLVKTKDASSKYYELLDLLKDVLLDYEIEEDGKTYKVNEKRIYVPLIVGVKDGKIVGYHTDVVDLEEGQSPFELLNKKQQEKLKEIYDDIKTKVYDDTCNLDSNHGC